ncbi:hypothetical protein AYO40_05150 [Planctomycetaceae bacterium SCGC AG-212-D15]|nr:hypothetical protein AYO40_05150 [Planctomycetaceae bacterium SCGC AG-212-D15]
MHAPTMAGQNVPPLRAVEVARPVNLSPRAQPLLKDGMTAMQFLTQLARHRLYADSIRFLTHTLTKEQAVWWGCLCVRHIGGRPLPLPQEAALQASVRWVLEPTEERRRAVAEPAEAAGLDSPAGCVAHGALWSGGSMAPPELPVTPPKPYMTARVVSGGILLASTTGDAKDFLGCQARLLTLGFDVRRGRAIWK